MLRKILFVLLILISMSAVFTGAAMITHPAGGILTLNPGLLTNSFFPDFFFPGILILMFVAVPSLFAVFFMAVNKKNQYRRAVWAGLLLTVWFIAQFLFIGSLHWTQAFLFAGAILATLISFQLNGKKLL